jgi:predicted pyridoxine 5'-phosphate oxidase superfamily flavin-nucleotide-binding protein
MKVLWNRERGRERGAERVVGSAEINRRAAEYAEEAQRRGMRSRHLPLKRYIIFSTQRNNREAQRRKDYGF